MTKLKITRCEIQGGDIVKMSGDSNIFTATINPARFKRKYKTRFSGIDRDGAIGKSKPVPKFDRSDPEHLTLTLTLDGTGVVPDAANTTVSAQIEKLRSIAYSYDGDDHQPNPVEVEWGGGLSDFQGRLTGLDVDYTLFQADGTPLRATVEMTFIEAITEEKEAKESNDKSPDMTHVLQVREGDTLPLMCQRVYKDVTRYLEIARANDLDDFRDLTPGMLLHFPPIR
ncbi:peptidoglycan-binding protein [Rhodovulum sulfidophilum]|uniref:Peptidoglycan-binding protein n=1 Tax=Rhodovulum visakhapatnamense TaxID=364297 RepID=A0ABS1RHW8_9RHOB|nr:peptidoglycan-binding protein [Rhodovulum visakhapatnamense]MBL3579257.1 peptidoglycan-binding protein [Rhodovulum visakhapatnamense]OLS45134.1 peptidoglycan-binding protein [Rhodovulum sulfidophilum]